MQLKFSILSLVKRRLVSNTLLVLLVLLFSQIAFGQTNFALTATPSSSGGGSGNPPGGFGPLNWNDNVIAAGPPCAESNQPWGWVFTDGSIMYTWGAPVTFVKIVFYKSNRPMTSCTCQYWDGSGFVTFFNYSGTICTEDSITFPPVTTTILRFLNVNGSSNPNFREIQVLGPAPNVPPAFTSSSPQNLNVCPNAGAVDIVPLLHVNDPDIGQTETWTIGSAPSNGTLNITGATASSGSANISPGGTLTYTPNALYTGPDAFSVQVSDGSATATMTINVNVAIPDASANPASQAVCSGSPITTIALTGTMAGTVYNWTRDNTAAVTGIAASGSGDISGVLNNVTNAPVTVTFTITPTNNGCVGTAINATVLVAPTPDVAQPASQTVCNGAATAAVNFTGSLAGTIFNWTNNNTSIGLAASGSGNIASFTGTNPTNAPVTATITGTPSTAAGGFAYVANLGDNNVSVVNTATNTVVALIPVGGSPFGASVSPDGTRAYTANFGSGNVSVINTATNTVVATVTVGTGPFGAAVTPDNSRVYVANASASNVSVINTATNTVIATIPVGGLARGVAVSPDGTKVYVSYTGFVAVINTATNTVSANISVGGNPLGIVFSPDGTRAYVAIQGSNIVTVINTSTNAIVTTIPAGAATSGIVITPDGSKLYATNFNGASVTVMSTASNSVITTVPTPGSSPYGISILPDGSQVYIGSQNNGTVLRINTATNTVVGAPITVGAQPFSFGKFITAGGASCTGSAKTFTITINPTATVNAVANQVVCNNATQPAILFSSPTTGGSIVYNWTNNTPSIGLAASGSGDIPTFVGTNASSSPVVATVTVTPAYTNNGVTCNGTPMSFTITVNPTATAIAAPSSQTVCSGSPITTIVLSGSAVAGTVYNWTRDNVATVTGIAASGSGDISGTLTNTTNVPVTVTFTITPTANGCNGAAITATVLIDPTPDVNQPANQVVCNNTSTAPVNFSGAVAGTVFSWTNNNTSIGLAASGTGNIASFNATNAGNVPVIATVTVTPSTPATTTTVTFNTVAGLQTFTVPAGVFSIHVDAFGAQGGNTAPTFNGEQGGKGGKVSADLAVVPGQVLNILVGGTTANATGGFNGGGNGTLGVGGGGGATDIRVGGVGLANRILVAGGGGAGGQNNNGSNHGNGGGLTGQGGSNSGSPSLIAGGGTQAAGGAGGKYDVGTCSPGAVCPSGVLGVGGNGLTGSASCVTIGGTGGGGGYFGGGGMQVNTAGGGSSYTDPAFTNVVHTQGVQTGNGLLTITYALSPTCTGTPKTFTITVNPTPNAVATPASQTKCSGVAITTIALTGNVAGTVYNWTRDNTGTATGIVANGTGDISGTLTNTTNVPVTVTFTITPTANGCAGIPITATVTVNPTPDVNQPPSQVVCNNTSTAPVNFSGTVAGTIFNWTNNTASIGLAASGTGNIASFTATNATNLPLTATVTVTPSTSGGGFAYISNASSGNVTVINTTTQTVAGTIPVGTNPYSLTANSATSKVYVANLSSNNVSVIDAAINSVVATITGINAPYGLATTPDGSKLYVSSFSGGNTVTVINTATNAILTTVAVGSNPVGIVPTPGGANMYVANSSSNTVSVINTATNTVSATIPVGTQPRGIAISPDGSKVYVFNFISATVSVINTSTNTVSATISVVAGGGYGIAVSTDGSRVYVAGANTVTVINATTNTVLTSVGVGINPYGISTSPDGTWVYAANFSSNNVSVISTATNTVSATIPAGSAPAALGAFITSGTTCTGTPKTFTITVNPTPNAVATPSSQTRCSGVAIQTIVLTGSVPGTVFNWTRDNGTLAGGPVSGIAASGSGDISGTLTNTVNIPIMVTFTVTPTANGCAGVPITATVLVNPTPNAVATPSSQTICNNLPITTIVISGNVAGTVFNWTRDNTVAVTGIAASGSGNISGTLNNATGAPVTVTFTITPLASGCAGTPITATVLVNPTPTATATPSSQTVCSGVPISTIVLSGSPVAGTVYNWTRNNSGTVTGIAASGSGNISGTLTNTTNIPITVTFTITPAANGCDGASITATVLVNPTPNATAIPSTQTICSGSTTQAIVFTGAVASTTYAWTRDNNATVTGLAASGSGNVPAVALTNLTNAAVTVTFTITPTANGCAGPSIAATIIVNPIPNAVATPSSQTICSGSGASIAFSGNVAGTVYSWTRDNNVNVTGLAAIGTGNINATLTNNTIVAQTVTFTITPSFTNAGMTCTGPSITATVTVNPIPNAVATPASQTICNNTPLNTIVLTGNVAGTVFNWVRDNNATVTGIPPSGTGDILAFIATNTTNLPVTVTFTITPTYTNNGVTCTGLSITATVLVNPTPTVNQVAGQVLCNGSATAPVVFTGSPAGAVFNWTNSNPSIGLAAGGTGNIPSFTATNNGSVPALAIITVTANYTNGGISCDGPPMLFQILVNPTASVNQPANQVVCNNTPTAPVIFTGPVPGTIFNWTNNNTSIGLAASGTGNIASFIATNPTNVPVVATITVAPLTNFSVTVTGFESGAFAPEWQVIGNTAVVPGTYGGVSPTQGIWQAELANHVGVTTAALESFLSQPAGSIDAFLGHPNTEGSAIRRTVTVNAGDVLQVDYDFVTAEVVPSIWDAALLSISGNGLNFLTSTYDNTQFIAMGGNPNGYTSQTGYRTVSYTFASGGTYDVGLLALNGYDMNVATGLLIDNFRINGGGGCGGSSKTFTITVKPTAHAVATPASQSVCSGSAIIPIVLTSDVVGTTYTWVRDNTVNVTGIAASGSGSPISGTLTNTTFLTQVVTFTITPTANGCAGLPITATVTVYPTPVVNPIPANQVVCNGSATNPIHFGPGPVAGTIYNWTNNHPEIGLAPAGTGDIASFIATNTANAPLTALITVTPVANGCTGPSSTFTITVNPTPIVNQPANQVVCNNTPTAAVNFTSPTTGGTIVYTWTHTGAQIGQGPDGVGNIPSFTAINNTGAPVVATFTVIATFTNQGVSCVSQPVSFTITVNPTPVANQQANQTVCNNTATAAVNFTGNAPGTVYNWTNSAPSIGLAAAGTGNIPSFTATNVTGAPVVATIVVTPTYTNAGVTCTGPTMTFTITVNPTPTVNAVASQVVCNGAPTTAVVFSGNAAGAVYNWTNNNTSIGLAASGTGNIASFTAINNGTTAVVATITVTPTYTGNGTTCTGTPITFTITVNPTPTVNAVASQTVCKGATTTAINFTGAVAGTVFNWTNNNTAIGLAASGTGNIAAFTAANPTSSPITATITVTPTANGCAGAPITFTITVNPTPAVNAVANQTLCAGASTIAVNFTSLTAGTTFAWTNNTPSIGLAASGTGNIASFVAVNAGTTPVTATITVTPSANGCTGAPITFTITVNPKANVAPVANQTLCNGSPTTAITFTGTVAGTIFNWTNSNTAIGLAATGQGNIPSFTATNNTAAPITATITVTPTTGGACAGATISFTITVNPTPTVNAIASQALCEGGTTTAINFSGATSGTVFTWTNNNTLIGLPASGTGNISPFVVTNGTGSTIVATITVTGAANGCTSAVRTFTITVFAGVNNIVITNAPQQVCLTDTLITLAATPAGGTWSGRGVSGNTFNAALAGVGTTTLVYTLGNGTCLGSASVNVTVRDCIERHNVFANAIHIYPNPNGGQFNIRYLSDVYHAFGVRIIDADGHLIHTYSFANLVYGSVIPFDLRSLPSGTYFLEVFNDFEKAAFRVVIMK